MCIYICIGDRGTHDIYNITMYIQSNLLLITSNMICMIVMWTISKRLHKVMACVWHWFSLKTAVGQSWNNLEKPIESAEIIGRRYTCNILYDRSCRHICLVACQSYSVCIECTVYTMWLVVWNIFSFSIYWESYSQLANILQRGWNHQPVIYTNVLGDIHNHTSICII